MLVWSRTYTRIRRRLFVRTANTASKAQLHLSLAKVLSPSMTWGPGLQPLAFAPRRGDVGGDSINNVYIYIYICAGFSKQLGGTPSSMEIQVPPPFTHPSHPTTSNDCLGAWAKVSQRINRLIRSAQPCPSIPTSTTSLPYRGLPPDHLQVPKGPKAKMRLFKGYKII